MIKYQVTWDGNDYCGHHDYITIPYEDADLLRMFGAYEPLAANSEIQAKFYHWLMNNYFPTATRIQSVSHCY